MLHLALTLNARSAERQRVQPRNGDLLGAAFANAVSPLLEAKDRTFDLQQFARFKLSQLRVHFAAASVKCQIGRIAGGVVALQVFQISAEAFPQFIAAAYQTLMEAEQGVTSCHGSPPFSCETEVECTGWGNAIQMPTSVK